MIPQLTLTPPLKNRDGKILLPHFTHENTEAPWKQLAKSKKPTQVAQPNPNLYF